MAWRIDEAVIFGEIDNRVRGRVTGRLWLVDRAEPVRLDLRGNCSRDLAGCRIQFTNPVRRAVDLDGFCALQEGVVGPITASCRVRVPPAPAGQYSGPHERAPKRLANALHLEWFSKGNCRVMIETTAFDLEIVGDRAWQISFEEEQAQSEANEARIVGFKQQLAGERNRPP